MASAQKRGTYVPRSCAFRRLCYNDRRVEGVHIMTAFQTQTFVPTDGIISVTLPERFRETRVELFISQKEKTKPSKMSKEERLAWMEKFAGSLHDVDYSDIREETDREI